MPAQGATPWDDVVRLAASISGCAIAFAALDTPAGPRLCAQRGLESAGPADELCASALHAAAGHAAAHPAGPELDPLPGFAAGTDAIWLVHTAALADAGGRPRGALCVADAGPRRLDADTRAALAALARVASAIPVAASPRPADGTPARASRNDAVAVAIVELDRTSVEPGSSDAVMARVERAVGDAVGAGDVVSRHDARELLLVFADPVAALPTLQRVRRAVEALPGAPRIAIGMATDTRGPRPLEELFLEAEADLRRARHHRPIVLGPEAGGTA